MPARLAAVALLPVLLACGDDAIRCANGYRAEAGTCVPIADAGDDGADAPLACTAPDDVPARPCTDRAASRCAAGECEACSADADCTHIAGAPRCADGQCVECTTATEADDCGTRACAAATNQCGAVDRGTLGSCEACAADSECGTDHRCIPMQYMAAAHGAYCLKLVSAGCAQPFSVSTAAESVSGASDTDYCGINQSLTTCEAVIARVGACPSTLATECAEQGARCETVGVIANKCTYSCLNSTECETGLTCNAGYCGS